MSVWKLHFGDSFSREKSLHVLRTVSAHILGGNFDDLLHQINEGDWNAIINREVDYSCFEDPNEVYILRQALAFYQKNASLPLSGIDRREAALRKFREAEDACLQTNRSLRSRGVPSCQERTRATYLFGVSRKISRILGPCPSLDELSFAFGPGANVGLRRLTSVRRKLAARPTCTPNAAMYLPYLQESHPHWDQLKKPVRCDKGRLTFVPKTAKTDRSIVVEPLVNTYLQKGVGSYIRDRLRDSGCNLNSQAKNQRFALLGSRDGSYATIDLSSASDTISRELVAALLPYDWWSLLDDLRTHRISMPDGSDIWLEKFSSMGNGFTFELESLIFFALAKLVVTDGEVSVYGDDIIVPTPFYSEMTRALEMFGFTVNTEKSFSSGPFRESCGKDFFAGVDVRPCYVKDRLSIKELFRLHNFFVRNCRNDVGDVILQFIPKRFRIYGPDGYGDGHLLGEWAPSPLNRKRGWGGYCFMTYTSRPNKLSDETIGDYPALLYLHQQRSPPDPLGTSAIGRYPGRVSFRPFLGKFRKEFLRDLAVDMVGENRGLSLSDVLHVERGSRGYRLTRIYIFGTRV